MEKRLVGYLKKIIEKLNEDISCKEYILEIKDDGSISDDEKNGLLDKYTDVFKRKECDLNNADINNLNNYLDEYKENDDKEMNTDSLWYVNRKNNKLYFFSLQGFSEEFIDTYKKMKKDSFLRYLFDGCFNEDDKINNIQDYISIKLREYINYLAAKVSDDGDINSNNLYEYISYISTLTYEGSSIDAKIALINKDLLEEFIDFYIRLDKPIEFKEYRKIRKLLETSDKVTYLIGDDKNIYGLGRFKNISNLKDENYVFIVDFIGKYEYRINKISCTCSQSENTLEDNVEVRRYKLKEDILVNVRCGKADLKEHRYSENDLENYFKDIFKNIDNDNIEVLKKVIRYAKDQKHGTTVVITPPDKAQQEVKKLEKQSIKIQKKELKDDKCLADIIHKITSIDGAVYLDTQGFCYAIGVILDGIADNNHGDSSRGARFNSAIKYSLKSEIKDECIIIVISEDGMIDIIHNGKVYGKEDKEINELFNVGEEFFNNNKFDEAIKIYDEIIEKDKSNCRAHYNKGIALYRLDKKEDALIYFNKTIKLDPEHVNAYNGKGITLKALGKKEEALECYDKAIELDSKYVKAYYNKGNTLDDLGRKEEALECYNKAIELDSEYAYAYNGKGVALEELGKNEEALECYDKAIELDSEFAYAYYNKSLVLKKLGRNAEAEECEKIYNELIKKEK